MRQIFTSFLILIFGWMFIQPIFQLEACKTSEDTRIATLFQPKDNCCSDEHVEPLTSNQHSFNSSSCCIKDLNKIDFTYKNNSEKQVKSADFTSFLLESPYSPHLKHQHDSYTTNHFLTPNTSPPNRTVSNRLSWIQIWRI